MGPQGPVGPQGPQGPVGPTSGLDPTTTALAVFAHALLSTSSVYPANQWTTLAFDQVDVDTHHTILPGPIWMWRPTIRGVYQLLANLVIDTAPGIPAFDLRVMRDGQEVVLQSVAGLTAQLHWIGLIGTGEMLQIEIRPTTLIPVQLRAGAPNTNLIIAGIGIAQ